MIEIKNLSVKYKNAENYSLKNISFKVNTGEMVAVIGRLNSGKTTLCQCINGLIPNFVEAKLEGSVIVDNVNIKDSKISEISSTVGMILENPLLQISGYAVTVEEEVAFGLENIGIKKDEMKRRVKDALNLVDLDGLKYKNPFEISGGQQQRLAIASIIAMNPKTLVLDDPTSQLDPLGTDEVFNELKKLKKNKTILLVTQKIEKIIGLADKVLVLNNGEMLAYDTPSKILTDYDLLKKAGIKIPLVVKIQHEKRIPKNKITLVVKELKEVITGESH